MPTSHVTVASDPGAEGSFEVVDARGRRHTLAASTLDPRILRVRVGQHLVVETDDGGAITAAHL